MSQLLQEKAPTIKDLEALNSATKEMENIYLTESRVYIAGILMPTIQVTITSTFNRPPQAEIILPAYSELLYMGERDRIPVHVFVRETMVESPRFILLFEGFISDTTYVNSAQQRSICIVAISFFDILNDIQLKFMTSLDDMFTAAAAKAQDLATHIRANKFVFPAFLLYYGITGNKDGLGFDDIIRFPSDYLENIYGYIQTAHPSPKSDSNNPPRDIHGMPYTTEPPRTAAHSSALSEYFSHQAQWLKLLDRFVRLPYFDEKGSKGYAWDMEDFKTQGPDGKEGTVFPMIYGMQQEAVVNLLAEGGNNAAPNQSMMELLMYLINEMEYEYLFVSNPAYYPAKVSASVGIIKGSAGVSESSSTATATQSSATQSSAVSSVGSVLVNNASQTASTAVKAVGSVTLPGKENAGKDEKVTNENKAKLVSSCVKPLLTDSLPPLCNIMYRSLVDSISVGVAHRGIPTRILIHNAHSALAHLTSASGVVPDFLKMYGLIDYYPSQKYEHFDPNQHGSDVYKKYLGTELLKEEKFTGPWVKQLNTPRWFHYLTIKPSVVNGNELPTPTITVNGRSDEATRVLKERFFRRQLLNSKYFHRQIEAQCMFDPYITPGFPGVIFDSSDSSFVFAGHVVTVIHTLSPGTVSTQVAMNFVRPLFEAAKDEIPNVLFSIQQITHDKEPLSEIYQRILGTNAEDFVSLTKLCRHTKDTTDPNNNPSVAFKSKRRNICSFDDYVSFMGFTVEYGDGPEGPATPLRLRGKWLEERYELPVFSKDVKFDPIIPEKEQMVSGLKDVKEEEEHDATDDGVEPGTEASTQTFSEKAGLTIKGKNQVYTVVDVCTLLTAIAKQEFSRIVYK